jgi:hypothetical protein
VGPSCAGETPVNLAFDTVDTRWDAGLVPRTTAAIGNFVWFDENEDGEQDEGNAKGLNGITVNLYKDDGDGVVEPGAGDRQGWRGRSRPGSPPTTSAVGPATTCSTS